MAAVILGVIALFLSLVMLFILWAGMFMDPEVSGTPQTGPVMGQ